MRRTLALAALLLAPALGHALEPVSFAPNPGDLAMYAHVPEVEGPLPLVLVLHGCSQDASFAEHAGFLDLADDLGFAVVAAEQSLSNNVSLCFNWFQEADITPGSGEAGSLRAMVEEMQARHPIDPDRIFVAGLSAGGAMSAVMLAVAPDLFAAGAVFSGVPYRCGVGVGASFWCMGGNVSHSQEDWAALVTDHVAHAGPWPRLLAVHGDADWTVDVANVDGLVLQSTGLHGIAAMPGANDEIDGVTWRDYGDVVTTAIIEGMGHGIPVAPAAGCGTAGTHLLDGGLCGSFEAISFFGLLEAPPGDTEEPDTDLEPEETDASEAFDLVPGEGGCSCATPPGAPLWLGALLGGWLLRSRR